MEHIEFIVVATTRTGEKSVVLHTLSAEYGRRSFLVSAGPKVPAALLQPLSIIDAEVVENPKSDLWRARNLQGAATLLSLRSDIFKNAMAMFLAEVLFRAVRETTYETGLYGWTRRQILLLDAMQGDFSNFHIRFLLELALQLGYEPTAQSLMPFAGEYLEELKSFVALPFAESMLMPLAGRSRNAIAEALVRYIAFHSETRLEVKSLKVLRELFI